MKLKLLLLTLIFSTIFVGVNSQGNRQIIDHTIFSKSLNETRIINIATPENYDFTNKTYPVLYVLDGEYVFSYAIGTVDFLSNPFGYLPEMIVVSIPNTNRNRDLFVTLNPEDGYVNFVKFLESEVVPFVNANYRTNGFDILYGWSSGSGICSYLLSTKPQLLDAYIQSGTGIGSKMADFMKTNLVSQQFKNAYLYANTESDGPRIPALNRFENVIKDIGLDGLLWKFEVLEGNHVETLSKGLYNGLKFVFADFYMPDSITLKGADETISYYNRIDKNYNFKVVIPMGAINESASILFQEGLVKEAVILLLHGTKLYPESPVLFGSLGEIYEELGEKEPAVEYYKIAIEKSGNNISNKNKYEVLIIELENSN